MKLPDRVRRWFWSKETVERKRLNVLEHAFCPTLKVGRHKYIPDYHKQAGALNNVTYYRGADVPDGMTIDLVTWRVYTGDYTGYICPGDGSFDLLALVYEERGKPETVIFPIPQNGRISIYKIPPQMPDWYKKE